MCVSVCVCLCACVCARRYLCGTEDAMFAARLASQEKKNLKEKKEIRTELNLLPIIKIINGGVIVYSQESCWQLH